MIPETLDGWTIETLRALLDQGGFESDRLEWKEMLPRDDGGRERLRLVMAAFANASGGFLLIGIKDSGAPGDRIVGVPSDAEVVHELSTLVARCEPHVDFTPKNPPLVLPTAHVVHVVHIPASARRPHGLVIDEAWRFPIRTAGGIRRMTWEELRDGFTDVRRRRRLLTSLRSEVDRVRELAEGVNSLANNWKFSRVREAIREFGRAFDASVIDRVVVEVADDIAGDPTLGKALNQLRSVVKEWDVGASEFGAVSRTREMTEREIGDRGQVAMRLAFAIHSAAHEVLRGLDAVAGSG